MKRISLIFSFCALLIILGTSGIKSVTNSGNPPAGRTGETGVYCTTSGCHSSNALNTAGGGAVISGLPTAASGYSLSQSYNFTLTINHNAINRKRWGFAIKAVNASGAVIGTFSTTNISANAGSGELRHNSAPTTPNANTYTFNNLKWVAPASNTLADKTIRFFVVGMAADGTGGTGGDFVYSNAINAPLVVAAVTSIKSFSPTKATAGSMITIMGTAFTGATNVNFGGVNASSYNVINDSTINATVGSGASGSVSVTSPNGVARLVGFTLCPTPTISNSNFTGCGSYTYKGTTYTSTTTVKDTTRTQQFCDSIYNSANITITKPVTPRIGVDADKSTACFGEKVIFTSNSLNGGSNPSYQWYKNGNTVGTNSILYADSLLNNGDSVYCVLTTSLTCVTAPTVKSVVLSIVINPYIKGNIITPKGNSIKNVTIKKFSSSNDSLLANANYNFNCSKAFSSGALRASKNNDVKKNNGVSSIDVILVQNHILNKIKLNSAYKIIAADVNNNKSVSNIDVILMKRLILGIDSSFSSNRLWAFVDSSYQFPDTTNPFPYRDSISFNNLTSNKNNQTFIGVKLGDVNYDWNPALARGAVNQNIQFFQENSITTAAKNEIRIPVLINNFKDIKALQYTFNFNHNDYDFVRLDNNKLAIEYNDNLAAKSGLVSFLWINAKGEEQSLENGSLLFELVLRSKGNVGANDVKLSISNDLTEIEVWDKNFNQKNIVLINRSSIKEQLTKKETWSVNPNPTTGSVIINFSAIDNKTVALELTDLQGKLVFQQLVNLNIGENSLNINLKKKNNVADGVYFLKAKGSSNNDIKRIVIKKG